MRNLFKNFFVFGVASALEKTLAFILLPLYARVFSVEAFGIVDLTQTAIGIMSIVAILQLETSLQRFYYEFDSIQKRKFIFTIITTITLLAWIIAFITLIFSKQLSNILYETTGYQNVLIIAILQVPFSLVFMISLFVLRFEKRNKDFIVLSLTKALLLFFLSYFILVHFNGGIIGLFTAQLISAIISSCLSIYLIRNEISYQFSKPLLKQALQYALPQFPARLGSTFIGSANRFFIVGYMSTFFVGLFSMASRFGSIMQLFHSIFMMAWNQFIFESIKNPNHKNIFSAAFDIIIPMLFLITSIMTLFSYEIIFYLATPEYLQAYKYVGWISLAMVLLSCKEIVDIGPKYLMKTHYLTINFLISAAFNVVAFLILIPIFKLNGVIISMVFTNLLLFLLSWYNSRRIYYIPYNMQKFTISTIPLLLILFAIQFDSLEKLPFRIIVGILAIVIYSIYLVIALRNYKKQLAKE